MRVFVNIDGVDRRVIYCDLRCVEVIEMSGICASGHNKFESCENCPDRSIEPNCHNTCRGYLFRVEKNTKLKESKRKDFDYYDFKKKVVENSKKHSGK